ncbi:MAG TPA: hypothetical protein VLJ10_05445 [Candidatus Bathyarchaeia archaeon]|nr:hypothetical protein [Candidatus Bathyarchaeia archaeon]
MTKLETTRLFHSSVSAGATEVIAKDGVVTLRGAAGVKTKGLDDGIGQVVTGVKAPCGDTPFRWPSRRSGKWTL